VVINGARPDVIGRACCSACERRQTARSVSAFCDYRSPDEMIALAVRWYLRFRLSYADVTEFLAERGIHGDPSRIFDWLRHEVA